MDDFFFDECPMQGTDSESGFDSDEEVEAVDKLRHAVLNQICEFDDESGDEWGDSGSDESVYLEPSGDSVTTEVGEQVQNYEEGEQEEDYDEGEQEEDYDEEDCQDKDCLVCEKGGVYHYEFEDSDFSKKRKHDGIKIKSENRCPNDQCLFRLCKGIHVTL